MSIVIPQSEFQERIVRFQAEMAARNLDAILVYGDEYRKENLRYVSNFWPIFERAVCMIPKSRNPVVAGAPEGESYAKEMSVWKDYVNVREFACVSVPEEIDYPLAKFVKLSDVIGNALAAANASASLACGTFPRRSSNGSKLRLRAWKSLMRCRSWQNSAL